jgi:ABC-type uncharacterized transport system ATPase subunit
VSYLVNILGHLLLGVSASVGKGGRNIPLVQRQAISLARGILSDADVLMLHKPTALLDSEHAAKVLSILHEYTTLGGASGILNRDGIKKLGRTPKDFLTGMCLALSIGLCPMGFRMS